MDDIDIILMMMEEDPDGVRWLLEKHGGRITAALNQKFGDVLDEHEVDGVLNGAAYKAYKAINQYDESKSKLRIWFAAIALNVARDVLRGERRFWTIPVDESLLSSARNKEDYSVDRKSQQYRRDLIEAIENLPQLQKAIIKADLKSDGIADAGRLAKRHGTTANSINVSRHKARQKLKELMRRKGYDVPSDTSRGRTL